MGWASSCPSSRTTRTRSPTGCVEKSDAICLSCEQARGLIYTGPVYAVEELVDCLYPWCIADGSAAARFDATFTDHLPGPGNVSEAVVAAVTTRTPGFTGWQHEHWAYHCADGAAFYERPRPDSNGGPAD